MIFYFRFALAKYYQYFSEILTTLGMNENWATSRFWTRTELNQILILPVWQEVKFQCMVPVVFGEPFSTCWLVLLVKSVDL